MVVLEGKRVNIDHQRIHLWPVRQGADIGRRIEMLVVVANKIEVRITRGKEVVQAVVSIIGGLSDDRRGTCPR